MNFATIDAALPEELADRIARVAHKANFERVMNDVANGAVDRFMMSVFDRAIQDGVQNMKEYMVAKYGNEVTVIEDEDIDWYTVLFLFPGTSRFAFYHHYAEWHTHDRFLVDGSYTPNMIHIERYLHQDRRGELATECDHIFNFIPFTQILPDADVDTFDFSAIGNKAWMHPTEILAAFNRMEYGAPS